MGLNLKRATKSHKNVYDQDFLLERSVQVGPRYEEIRIKISRTELGGNSGDQMLPLALAYLLFCFRIATDRGNEGKIPLRISDRPNVPMRI
jgi:hypothetical protein